MQFGAGFKSYDFFPDFKIYWRDKDIGKRSLNSL